MLLLRDEGLYCPAGDFFIDPRRAVARAIITHAHSDHARRGSKEYITVRSGLSLLRSRLGAKIHARGYPYGEAFQLGEASVSLHPAGHILGSAQVRIESGGEVWVVSGDYKREPDPTCDPFEVLNCDVFVTEATFGSPQYRWPREEGRDLGRDIHAWWKECEKEGDNAVLFAYSLGKAQRVLAELARYAKKPVYTYPTVTELTECYRSEGVRLAETRCLSSIPKSKELKGEMILAPPSVLKSQFSDAIGSSYQTAFASGWMARGSWGYDRGFVMSDHADYEDLLKTIRETRAHSVYVIGEKATSLLRQVKKGGQDCYPISELIRPARRPAPRQLSLL